MRDIRTRRTVRGGLVALGAAVALGAPCAAFAQSSDGAEPARSAVAASSVEGRQGKTQKLSDGSIAKVTKVGDHFEATIVYKGKKIGTLNQAKTVLRHHGVTYSFHPYTGKVWAEKSKGKGNTPEPRPDDRTDKRDKNKKQDKRVYVVKEWTEFDGLNMVHFTKWSNGKITKWLEKSKPIDPPTPDDPTTPDNPTPTPAPAPAANDVPMAG